MFYRIGEEISQNSEVLSCEFCKISKNIFSYKTFPVTASELYLSKTVLGKSIIRDVWHELKYASKTIAICVVRRPIYLFIYLLIYIYIYIYLFIYLFTYTYIYLFIYLFIYLYIYIYLFIYHDLLMLSKVQKSKKKILLYLMSNFQTGTDSCSDIFEKQLQHFMEFQIYRRKKNWP